MLFLRLRAKIYVPALFAATNKGIADSAEATDGSLRVAIKNVKDHPEYPCSGLLVTGL